MPSRGASEQIATTTLLNTVTTTIDGDTETDYYDDFSNLFLHKLKPTEGYLRELQAQNRERAIWSSVSSLARTSQRTLTTRGFSADLSTNQGQPQPTPSPVAPSSPQNLHLHLHLLNLQPLGQARPRQSPYLYLYLYLHLRLPLKPPSQLPSQLYLHLPPRLHHSHLRPRSLQLISLPFCTPPSTSPLHQPRITQYLHHRLYHRGRFKSSLLEMRFCLIRP